MNTPMHTPEPFLTPWQAVRAVALGFVLGLPFLALCFVCFR